MATKEQERKALAKIQNIVEELGADSYISMAFEGCFEVAQENIENDFGCSLYQRAKAAEAREQAALEQNRKLTVELKAAQAEVEGANSLAELRDEQNNRLHKIIAERDEQIDSQKKEIEKMKREVEIAKEIFRHKGEEIVRLKARLFDLLYDGEDDE